jgi:D-proline reductase (dithiol) PrdB
MVEIDALPLRHRIFLRAYPWRHVELPPPATLGRPLAAARVALVSSAGLVVPGDPPFDARRGGDPGWRVVPHDADLATLEDHQRSETYDHAGVRADPNLALPIERLHELAAAGAIGAVAPRHVSCMGSLTAVGRFVRDSLPAIGDLLVADRVDVALLVPV